MLKKFRKIFSIGLMSGTSMDGINVSMVKTNGLVLDQCNLNIIRPYSNETLNLLKKVMVNIQYFLQEKDTLLKLEKLITLDHFEAIQYLLKKTKYKPDIIGFHGQTIFHDPKKKISIQIGNPQLLAELLNKSVVGNFRSEDIKNGGEGAPIAPIYHKLIIEKFKLDLPSCFLNLGGVSNLTYWDGKELIGFDTGPGNGLMDIYMQENYNKKFDCHGSLAKKGVVIQDHVKKFMKDTFFKKKYPKSLDKLYFSYIFERIKNNNYKPEDIMATLSELTVMSIVFGIKSLPQKPKKIYIMGGGVHNTNLINCIQNSFPNNYVNTIDDIGLSGDMIEAELMAFLAVRKLYNFSSTFPETTGVLKPTCLGELFLNKKDDFI